MHDQRPSPLRVLEQPATQPVEERVEQLRGELRRLERERRRPAPGLASAQTLQAATAVDPVELRCSSGCPAVDRLLPSGGFLRGSLVEFLGERGSGAGTLAWLAAREAAREGRVVIALDRARRFYPPAALAWGMEADRLIVVRPATVPEELWALDQSLRCAAVASVWVALERLDWRWFRRLQLAAEATGTLGLLLRPPHLLGQPSWADVQLRVTPCRAAEPKSAARPVSGERWRLRVQLQRCRHGQAGGSVELALDEITGEVREGTSHETHALPVVTALAAPALARRASRTRRPGPGAVHHG